MVSLLTKSDRFLKSYETGVRELDGALDVLRANPTASYSADELRRLAAEKMALLGEMIRLEREQRSNEAEAIVKSGQGLAQMDAIEAEATRLQTGLKAEFARNLHENEQSLKIMQRAVILSSAIAALLVIPGLVLLRLEIRQRTGKWKRSCRRAECQTQSTGAHSGNSKIQRRSAARGGAAA